MYENVLVPTDGSEGVASAVEHAVDIASTYGATVHALYVVDTTYPTDIEETSVEETMVADLLEEEGESATDEVAARARDAGVEVVTAVRRGRPVRTILDYVGEHDVDLVVMGTHGRSGLDRFLLGSVTETVVRSADVPVLTVRLSGGDEGEGDGE